MAGLGKTSKKFYVNLGHQETDFDTKSASMYGLSGHLASMPDFNPNYEAIKIPSHNNLGESYKVLQGQSKHGITLPYSDLVDWRFLGHIAGGRLDQPRVANMESGSGTWQSNEEATNPAGATAETESVAGTVGDPDVTFKVLQVGESMTGSVSAAVVTLVSIKGSTMVVKVTSGVVVATDVFTGSISGAKMAVDTVTNVTTFEMLLFSDADVLTGGTSSADGTISTDGIVYQHDLFPQAKVEPKSIVYVHESITDFMHELIGGACDDVEVKGVAGTAPVTGSASYKCSAYTPQATIDDEIPTDEILGCFEYSQVDFSINSVAYEGKARAFTMQMSRGHADIPTFDGINPKGYGSGAFTSKLTFEIHMEDFTLITLMQAATEFDVVVNVIRTADEDEMQATFSCVLLSNPLKDGQNTIMVTVAPEIQGVPAIMVRNRIAELN